MSKKHKHESKPGRPLGSKTADRVFVAIKPPACPKCQSTRREPFRTGPVRERSISGIMDGQLYNRVVWRDTRCSDCGQFMRVVEYLYEPEVKLDPVAVDEIFSEAEEV